MGCDIHGPWVFGKRTLAGSREWWDKIAELEYQRNYDIFALFADVRNDGTMVPIDAPRGPHPAWDDPTFSFAFHDVREQEDFVTMSCGAYHRHTVSADCHSQSWLTTDEVVEAQVRYAAEKDPETHARNGPNSDLAITIALMRTAEQMGYTDVHIGFCFDN